jgi:hypothetical protein
LLKSIDSDLLKAARGAHDAVETDRQFGDVVSAARGRDGFTNDAGCDLGRADVGTGNASSGTVENCSAKAGAVNLRSATEREQKQKKAANDGACGTILH